MFYLKINEKIRSLIDKLPKLHFGCKYYCPHQLIALDEMEYLRKELANIKITFTDEEFKEIIKSFSSSARSFNIMLVFPLLLFSSINSKYVVSFL